MLINHDQFQINFDGFANSTGMEVHLKQVVSNGEIVYDTYFTKLSMTDFGSIMNACYKYIQDNLSDFQTDSGNYDE